MTHGIPRMSSNDIEDDSIVDPISDVDVNVKAMRVSEFQSNKSALINVEGETFSHVFF